VTYAKAGPDDLLLQVACTNRGPDAAPLHVLPTVWFRNTWSWGRDDRHPSLAADGHHAVRCEHATLGRFWLHVDGDCRLLFVENETNAARLFGSADGARWPKDGINDHVVHDCPSVNPAAVGTKAAAWYRLDLAPGA